MPRILCSFLLLLALASSSFASQHVILTGGPALRKWENLRTPNNQHDKWWANFIRASTLQMDILRKQNETNESITWYVIKSGYIRRGAEDGKPYTTWIQEQATKRGAKLIWIRTGNDFIRSFNRLPKGQTKTFNYFGHSNKHCFLLDYSSSILGASDSWLHERDLKSLSRRPFSRKAICKSWGCYTGQSMSKSWSKATGRKLIGAKGKTDYEALSFGKMPTTKSRWVR